MEEVCDESEEPQATGKNDELILLTKLLKELLLIFLYLLESD